MSSMIKLTLYEEILLLALDDRKGTSALDSGHANTMGRPCSPMPTAWTNARRWSR